jgi:hypothetical protein
VVWRRLIWHVVRLTLWTTVLWLILCRERDNTV